MILIAEGLCFYLDLSLSPQRTQATLKENMKMNCGCWGIGRGKVVILWVHTFLTQLYKSKLWQGLLYLCYTENSTQTWVCYTDPITHQKATSAHMRVLYFSHSVFELCEFIMTLLYLMVCLCINWHYEVSTCYSYSSPVVVLLYTLYCKVHFYWDFLYSSYLWPYKVLPRHY